MYILCTYDSRELIDINESKIESSSCPLPAQATPLYKAKSKWPSAKHTSLCGSLKDQTLTRAEQSSSTNTRRARFVVVALAISALRN